MKMMIETSGSDDRSNIPGEDLGNDERYPTQQYAVVPMKNRVDFAACLGF
jgi:hypothetical protein